MVVLPKTQALNSTTFKAPPLEDEAHLLPELYDWQSINSPNHPLFIYDEAPGKLKTIHWSEAVRGFHRAAHYIASLFPSSVIQDAINGKSVTIGTLAASDTITYFSAEVGIIRAGFGVFPISPRNSPEAIAHLLKKTGTKYLMVGKEAPLQKLAAATLEILKRDEGTDESINVAVFDMPIFEDLYPSGKSADSEKPYPTVRYDPQSIALILHSSGSTAFPKPIRWTHRNLVTLTYIPWYGEMDLCGQVMSCHAMPVFHGMGLLQLALVVSSGVSMAVFKPLFPAVIPNPQNVLEGMMVSKCTLGASAPTFLEVWSHNPEAVKFLSGMEALMWGGGPLPKAVGDTLTKNGVTIHSQYGCSECGVMNTVLPARSKGEDWEYFTISPHCKPSFLPQDDGTFELVLIDHPSHHPVVLNTKVDGQDAYATSDLLVPHPTKPGLWKIFGRSDDQIMLSTGERTNPGPLEGILNQDPHVVSSVMFGRGRFQNGVIIDPKPQFAFDPTDERQLEAFRNAIWPTVERMNNYAPQHSRLFKEMIVVALPSKPFVYTAKMTARRQAIIKEYEPEINALYTSIEDSSQVDISAPSDWSPPETLTFVQQVVAHTLKGNAADDEDLFQCGCDSLQSTWIRNSILRALRETVPEVAKRLPTTFVYDHPTINQMVSYICRAVQNPHLDQRIDLVTRGMELQAVVDNLTAEFPSHTPAPGSSTSSGEVYFLTGSTGGLGSNALAQLLAKEGVTKVYAFNRPSSGKSSAERHREAFAKRGLDSKLLEGGKVVYVEGELGEPLFGTSEAAYEEMRTSVTHIVHSAWRINLNLSLRSFESNVRGVRNLIDFSLSSPRAEPPRFIFVSSIAVFIHFDNKGYVKEEILSDSKIAIGTGYSESKWIAERILDAAAEKTVLRPVVVRLGQVSGDGTGMWNETEWLPSLVKSALSVKCLPDLEGTVSWITAPDAAAALLEMGQSPFQTLHIAHPRGVSYTSLITPIAQHFGVPLVSYQDWVKALETDLQDNTLSEVEHMQRNPALRLLDFFRVARVGPEWEPVAVARLGTDKAVQVSETLREKAPRLGEEDVQKRLNAWKAIGFLP